MDVLNALVERGQGCPLLSAVVIAGALCALCEGLVRLTL
jgi:hypothetical protein